MLLCLVSSYFVLALTLAYAPMPVDYGVRFSSVIGMLAHVVLANTALCGITWFLLVKLIRKGKPLSRAASSVVFMFSAMFFLFTSTMVYGAVSEFIGLKPSLFASHMQWLSTTVYRLVLDLAALLLTLSLLLLASFVLSKTIQIASKR